ncbi:glycoside hydrolase family 35 protein [Saccharata proteae CBS 121410]|uniref:Beta-galactosidase n=1 Tax=Saccharata proteae CBS 121410 TaxID=1314787 RepID=A0A6A5YDP5_9PEZI|nr:glycoside hydrolase family 35 protein [Saccharata proteae CBS 121410]
MLAIGPLRALLLSCLAVQTIALVIGGKPNQVIKPYKREALQDIVTWDEHSLYVRGERVLFLSGEFHPYRLPVPGLWLDIFQKVKALGFNGVSFYTDWALLEGKPGNFSAEGVFAFEPFFDAAKEAGIYLLARPGPYINAEASGGGFPGWLQRNPGILRTYNEDYLNATDLYAKSIGEIIAKAQITNGGPIILMQPENEYTGAVSGVKFPDPDYFGYVEDQFRNAGVVVPFISNDASPDGNFAPGSESAVDIYGHDGYPLGFDCANPYTWPDGSLPTTWRTTHLDESPTTPYALVEFQGGSFDPWGGLGFDQCSELLNYEFERVFYKNDYSFGVTILNLYMIFGGTNWGNLGHPGGYTSYDYGSVIRENRLVDREKYSELKLQANFLMVTPAYLTVTPANSSTNASGYTTSADLNVTPLFGKTTNFFVIRHAAYNSLESTMYKLNLPTSQGNITVPQLNGTLTLNGRDSKIHVTDYSIGDYNVLYSSAEIFSWKQYDSKTVLVVYGGPGEHHELAISGVAQATSVEGSGVSTVSKDGSVILNWQTSSTRRVVKVEGDLYVYILEDRNSAYDYWVLETPQVAHAAPLGVTSNTTSTPAIIAKAGYLLRNATVLGSTVALVGDLNTTASLEIIGGAPDKLSELTFNGDSIPFNQTNTGSVLATLSYTEPSVKLPELSTTEWKYIDTLPEISSDYSDDDWTVASNAYSNNTVRNITTTTSLYASDYGYNTGVLLYRGHFDATGDESTLTLVTQGGSAFGMSAWLDSTYLGSYAGIDAATNATNTFTLPNLSAGTSHVITVVVDNMGLDEDWTVGSEEMKDPRGILDYTLTGHAASDVTWRLTGNLGGEDYADHVRGPLNEGGLFAERQGFHLPSPPISDWESVTGGPITGIDTAGIGFYVTSFDLDLPAGYDIPLSFNFANSSVSTNASAGTTAQAYRALLFVNGYQFGKYVHNVGPQDSFPVPEGIFDYHGTNWVAISLWSLEADGAKLDGLELVVDAVVQSGYGAVQLSPMSAWEEREGAY